MWNSNADQATLSSVAAAVLPGFSIACICAGTLPEINIATAACRTGSVGLLDLTLNFADEEKRLAETHLRALLTDAGSACGVRIRASQLLEWPEVQALLSGCGAWLILADWQSVAGTQLTAALPAGAAVFLEMTSPEQVSEEREPEFPFIGWIARGSELEGSTTEVSAYVLLQSLSRQRRPFLLMDPVGAEAIAACRIGGGAGVVLKDSTLIGERPPSGAALTRGVARSLYRLRAAVDEVVELAAIGPFRPGNALAKDHGTKFPIVQGPMTRVSDCAAFAQSVAESGALPMLALALHPGSTCDTLIDETVERLGGRPWGVGLLGFAPPEILEEQLACVNRARPPFCVLSGGRPDQVVKLEREGTATYLHVPVPAFIRPFFERGVRRFVFEGSECGGHTGPLTSFALWGQAVEVLLRFSNEELRGVSVLFAGGIHDDLSSAMASAFAARLSARGARVGLLMGTAYLFTDEIVETSAILPAFQAEAVRCRATARIVTGPGHLIRCAPTPFIEEFSQQRAEWEESGRTAKEISSELEKLTLGRARAASRGLWRDDDGAVAELSEAEQQRLGMYMMGDVAAFRDAVLPIATLHAEVTEGAWLAAQDAAESLHMKPEAPRGEPVAIIGMSGLVPGATTLESFWRMQLDGGNPITEIPRSRFDWRLHFDESMQARDKIYSRWGGFLDEVPFDPISFGIPPISLRAISPLQLLGLEVARRALADAGYGDSPGGNLAPFDRENTSLCLGVSSGADLHHMYITRANLPSATAEVSDEAADRMPEWTEESFPGTLLNVIAGRISNRLDLGGSNRVVDAACASSLAAIQIAVADLQAGRTNMAITGGIDLDQTPHSYTAFSKTQALSPKGVSRPFDRKADGIVLSEGVVLFVLKRLSDAEREGDRIYAVIRSVEGSSDGKGRSLTAPRPAGQRRALDRAYSAAGIDPASVGLYEAHGTGTAVGDRAELETVTQVLTDAGAAPQNCAIGSAKALIGHTKSAAGAVSMMKVAMALHHRALPPLHSLREPLDPLLRQDSPVTVYGQPTPWLSDGLSRRAGVSAFGFGGTNYHAVLEEYVTDEGAPGSDVWPCELFLFAADERQTLKKQVESLISQVTERPSESMRALAFACAVSASGRDSAPIRLAFVARDTAELRQVCDKATALLSDGKGEEHSAGLHLQDTRLCDAGKVAFLFPGQGSQYVGMGRETSLYFEEMRRALEFGDKVAAGMHGGPLSRLMMPPSAFTKEAVEQQTAAITATDVAQPAIGVHSCGMLQFALRVGLTPDVLAGHSYGEFVALHAAGVISREDLMRLSLIRGRVMRDAGLQSPGSMAAVRMRAEELQQLVKLNGDLTIANFNAPLQCVLSGSNKALDTAMQQLRERGVGYKQLPVAAAFHSPAMTTAAAPLARAIDATTIHAPLLPVYSNYEGLAYAKEMPAIKERLKAHLNRPVHFESQIRAMYAAGVRTFIEVGPRDVLTALTGAILGDLPHQAVALDGAGGGLQGCLNALAMIHSVGLDWKPLDLFAQRVIESPKFQQPNTPFEWFVDGGRVRHFSETVGLTGVKPLATLETAQEHAQRASRVPHVDESAISSTNGHAELLQAYGEYQQTMRELVDSQERILLALLDRVEKSGSADQQTLPWRAIEQPLVAPSLTAAVEELAPPPTTLMPSTFNTAEITELVLTVISQRTGYPPDLLNLDDDVEADIGVDSIKRIDILLEIERRMPPSTAETLQEQMSNLNQFRTVRGLVGVLSDVVRNANAKEIAEPMIAELPIGKESTPWSTDEETASSLLFELEESSCPRFVMRAHRKRLARKHMVALNGLYLVTEDKLGVASHAAEALRELGAEAHVIPAAELQSRELLQSHLEHLQQEYGQAIGVLHLASLTDEATTDVAGWRVEAQIQVKSLFQIAQHCAAELQQSRSMTCTVLAATGFGGMWARSFATQSCCAAAGVHGLLRTVQLEQQRFSTSVIDFDPKMHPGQIADCLIAELLATEQDPEVGYRDGERFIFSPEPAMLTTSQDANGWRPTTGSVVVVTGGARGITARIAEEFAVPGVRLVLLGRGGTCDSGIDLDISVQATRRVREEMIAEAHDTGRSLKPAMLETKVQAELQRRERTATLARLQSMGAEVTYEIVDVQDTEALRSCLRSIYAQFGKIDAIIHGAGVLDDGPLLRKSIESFDTVFHTKTDSLLIFEQEIHPGSLRCLLLFSSVSGRFGNPGQIDYAAANEVLTRWAWQAAGRWPDAHVLAICWGPWAEIGMAANEVEHKLRERDILPIDPIDGCRFVSAELAAGAACGSEVIAGEGFWGQASVSSLTILDSELALSGASQRISEDSQAY